MPSLTSPASAAGGASITLSIARFNAAAETLCGRRSSCSSPHRSFPQSAGCPPLPSDPDAESALRRRGVRYCLTQARLDSVAATSETLVSFCPHVIVGARHLAARGGPWTDKRAPFPPRLRHGRKKPGSTDSEPTRRLQQSRPSSNGPCTRGDACPVGRPPTPGVY